MSFQISKLKVRSKLRGIEPGAIKGETGAEIGAQVQCLKTVDFVVLLIEKILHPPKDGEILGNTVTSIDARYRIIFSINANKGSSIDIFPVAHEPKFEPRSKNPLARESQPNCSLVPGTSRQSRIAVEILRCEVGVVRVDKEPLIGSEPKGSLETFGKCSSCVNGRKSGD